MSKELLNNVIYMGLKCTLWLSLKAKKSEIAEKDLHASRGDGLKTSVISRQPREDWKIEFPISSV